MKKYYYAGGVRVGMRTGSNNPLWLLGDHLGSTSKVASYDGLSVPSQQLYKPWGEGRYASGTLPTTYKFTGQREESYINLYWYNSRWYDPALGRFVQGDSIVPNPGDPVAWDRYAYTRNNPVNLVDPSGHGYCDSEYAVAEECQGYLPNLLASLQNHGVFLEPLDSITPGEFYFDAIDHPGQDYPNPTGSSIYAPAEGVVILVDDCSASDCISQIRGEFNAPFNQGYGNVVVIEYPYNVLPAELIDANGLEPGQSLFVLYAHLQNPSTLHPGDTVAAGQVIGSVGSTGYSTGPHLHLEVRVSITGSLPYGYMCDDACFSIRKIGNPARFSDWYSSGDYRAINPLDINYIPFSNAYFYVASYIMR